MTKLIKVTHFMLNHILFQLFVTEKSGVEVNDFRIIAGNY